MTTNLVICQLGIKKDRTYRVQFVNNQTQVFTIKGEGKNFVIFNASQKLNSFKTLTKCYEFIKSIN